MSVGIPIQIDASGPVTENMLVKVAEASANSSAASLRKKRKVSFAPNLPTSYGNRSQKHALQDGGREATGTGTEPVSRRSTRSSTYQNGGAAKPPQDVVESRLPILSHALIRNTKDTELREYMERSESLGSCSHAAEKLSDEESVCSSVSSVASTTSNGVSSQKAGVTLKRRGRPPGSKNKGYLVKPKKAMAAEERKKHEQEVAQRIRQEVGRRKLPEAGQRMELEVGVGMEPEVEQCVEPEVGRSAEPEVGQRVEPVPEELSVRVLSVAENIIARGWFLYVASILSHTSSLLQTPM